MHFHQISFKRYLFTKKIPSWPLGGIGALQVDEEYQRRGLGALVTKAISRKIAEMGHDVCTDVTEGNVPSQTLFEKLGFASVFDIHKVTIFPTHLNVN